MAAAGDGVVSVKATTTTTNPLLGDNNPTTATTTGTTTISTAAQPQQPSSTSSTKYYDLKPEEELRVEVRHHSIAADHSTTTTVLLSLLSGTCECFGTELASHHPYFIPAGTADSALAFFTWHGCRLSVDGACHSYVAQQTVMPSCANFHHVIERLRVKAKQDPQSAKGPVVVICGPTDSGKSSLAKILLAYAFRQGRKPIYVDVDIGQGSVTVPGAVCAISVEQLPQPGESFAACGNAPVAFYMGHHLVQILSETVRKRMENDPDAASSGLVINTCGWIDGLGFELLLNIIEVFRATHVVVIEHERLFHDLSQKFGGSSDCEIAKFPKSGGVVSRNSVFRRKSRMNKIREYFYGLHGDLCPLQTEISFKDIVFLRIGGGPIAPASALPIGAQTTYDPLRVVEFTPSSEILHSLLAVVHASSTSEVLSANVAGFIYITEVNFDKRILTALIPRPGAIPSKYVVSGSLKWLEE